MSGPYLTGYAGKPSSALQTRSQATRTCQNDVCCFEGSPTDRIAGSGKGSPAGSEVQYLQHASKRSDWTCENHFHDFGVRCHATDSSRLDHASYSTLPRESTPTPR
ncbi:hypothetical protein COCON_G00015780 [Conger conger]|uniref:Uncharacterized protein n=1 Tax=Conger conger TaxID=82655 RepID=A0A9Q1E3H9_CONCO|nr:hypothetical protein COCON_G00015780 [Conger conger]